MTLREAAQQALAALETPIHEQSFRQRQDVLAALKAALEQEQEQEPVAWIHGDEYGDACHWVGGRMPPAGTNLYTAPPRRAWQGLTESEIQSLHDYYVKRLGPIEFACAIEAALKEKNHD